MEIKPSPSLQSSSGETSTFLRSIGGSQIQIHFSFFLLLFFFKCSLFSLSLWLIYLFSSQNKPLYTYNEHSCCQMLLVSAPLFNRFSFLCISTRSRMGNNLKIVLLQTVTLRDFQPLQTTKYVRKNSVRWCQTFIFFSF